MPDGRGVRFHIKRYRAIRGVTPGEQEMEGIFLLQRAKIPTVTPAAWGRLDDGRSFVVTEDLGDYADCEKLVASGLTFGRLLEPTALLAARLHKAGLHHRDLYLCHFFAKVDGGGVDLKLIDPGRVGELAGWFRQRWIVKDLAQFWYSTMSLNIPDADRSAWLDAYVATRKIGDPSALRRSIEKKVAWIARHDAGLRAKQPNRNVSLPE
jgi:heptose I phosphotransferase